MDKKDEVIRQITARCSSFVPSELLSRLECVLVMSLHDYAVTTQETALSTQVEIPNEKYINQFMAIKKIQGLSDKTLAAYLQEINFFFRSMPKPIKEITTNDIRFYLASEQANRGISNVTLDNKLRFLRSFFKTLRIEGLLPSDPTEKINNIKTPKTIKKPFSDEELEVLRMTALQDKRTRAIVEFLASTGCRVGEVSAANRADIQGDRVLVTGKGNKQRYVYLNAKARLALDDYLSSRTDNNEALFVGSRKVNPAYGPNRLDTGQIEKIIRELGRDAGVENCHCHRFRRTTATQALKSGMPIEQVSIMLGHEKLTTTQIYARSDETDVHAAHKKYVR